MTRHTGTPAQQTAARVAGLAYRMTFGTLVTLILKSTTDCLSRTTRWKLFRISWRTSGSFESASLAILFAAQALSCSSQRSL
jgi:hypothetical protein